MIHMTLKSFHDDAPVDPDDDGHPDGLLWPVTIEEFDDLPRGTKLEGISYPSEYVVGSGMSITLSIDDNGYVGYGIRGRREEN